MSKKVVPTRETRNIMSLFSTSRIEWRKNETKCPVKRGRLFFFLILNTALVRPIVQLSQLCYCCLMFLIISYSLSLFTHYQRLFLPEAQLNIKCKTKRTLFAGCPVSFLVFNSILDFEVNISHITENQVGIFRNFNSRHSFRY